MGLYWRGANATGAAAAIIVGTLAVLGWENFGDPGTVDPLWIAAPMTFLVIIVVSLATGGTRARRLATRDLTP
jgi:Na+/proline symporter